MRKTLSFYRYMPVADPRALRDALFIAWSPLAVLGRIYVAHEGINAQLSVPEERFEALRDDLESREGLKGLRLNLAVEQQEQAFDKLKIKVRQKIVADGIDDPSFDPARTGPHLSAREFNALATRPGTVLVDMRNRYESEIGHFVEAVLPDADTFRESLDAAVEALADPEKTVLMYCTGGIRCEKASAFLRHKGFRQVYQLEGGIIEYLRQVKRDALENRFQGKNFVFDGRMGERISDHVVGRCHFCGSPCDVHSNCRNETCHTLMLQCASCAEKLGACCSEACRAFADLPEPERRERRKGVKRPWQPFHRSKPVTEP